MRQAEDEEPGSEEYNDRLWRRSRNEKLLARTQPLKVLAGSNPWNLATSSLANPTQPARMCFEQFDDCLAVVDDADGIW